MAAHAVARQTLGRDRTPRERVKPGFVVVETWIPGLRRRETEGILDSDMGQSATAKNCLVWFDPVLCFDRISLMQSEQLKHNLREVTMPTRINGCVSQQGRGVLVCTFTGGSRLSDQMKLGPDGNDWDLLDDQEVTALFTGPATFRHIAKEKISHLCAGMGGWAFTVFSSSSPHAVAFLHLRTPSKLDSVMGGGSNVLTFTTAEMLKGYQYAQLGSRSPRVWRRNLRAADEIAINFCVKNG